ncbi:MAG TPA: L,D-transpeptidase [Acidimicrobiales bacterium]|nr:L,D-transpeptidase [Acidimicrobiales bacterium]
MRRGGWPVLLAVVLLTVACARSGPGPARVVAPTTVAVPVTAPAPPPPPPPPPKAVVATARAAEVAVYDAPGAAAPLRSFSHPNELGEPRVFLVRDVQGDWLNVLLPARPNGSTGWLRAADVTLAEHDWRIEVALGAHRLTVWKGGELVREETVAVGMPAAPTPTGDFYLTELLDTGNPRGPYGPWAFGLSAYSEVYTSFAGGPGQVGLHGTNQPGALGTDASHGCIRLANEAITALSEQVPVGTPIKIVP